MIYRSWSFITYSLPETPDCVTISDSFDPYIRYFLEHLYVVQKRANIILISNLGFFAKRLIDEHLSHIAAHVRYIDTQEFVNTVRLKEFEGFTFRTLIPGGETGKKVPLFVVLIGSAILAP